MDYRAYADMAPDIGLNQQQIRILSEQGRARIAAENAAKDAKRREKQEERMRRQGWKETMGQGLELVRGLVKTAGVNMGKGQRGGRQEYEKMG